MGESDISYCTIHCERCILSSCESSTCPVSECPNGCGMRLHSCKVYDHMEQVCSNYVVPCLNMVNGCPYSMPRRNRRFHLLTCPASVVCCTVPCLNSPGREFTTTTVHTGPDRIGAIRPFQPPISPAPLLSQNLLIQKTSSYVSDGDHQEESDIPVKLNTSIKVKPFKNQLDQIDKALESLNVNEVNNSVNNKFFDSPLLPYLPDLATSKSFHTGKKKICGHLVQRIYYAPHYRLHSDVEDQMDGWIELRCPLAFLGCTYAVVCLRPNNEQNSLLYNPILSTFTTRFEPTEQSKSAMVYNTKNNFDINKLPTELLLRLSLYLDDFTLLNLSRVSLRLSQVYRRILHGRLVVTPKWEKIVYKSSNTTSWKITNYIWLFPERAELICSWKFSPGLPARTKLASHLVSCEYNKITIHKDPFSLLHGHKENTDP